MGKLMHNTQVKHSSHPHLLHLASNLHLQNQPCGGCNLQITPTDHTYTCRSCKYFLHASCAKFPELITHPSHRQHPLALLPIPIYPGGFFRCDACAQQGTRFSYHCQICDFDLHVLCATKPLSVTHPLHQHPLLLNFSSPYGEKIGFSCDVCRNIGSSDQWLYRCVSCEFDVHLHCAIAKIPLQHQHSFPGTAPNHVVGPLAHSMSTGAILQGYQQQQTAVGFQGYQMQPQMQQQTAVGGGQGYQMRPQTQTAVGVQSYQMQQQTAVGGVQGYQMQPQAGVGGVQGYQMQGQPFGPGVGNQNGLGDVIVTGFVEGVMQQIGQNFVQSLTGSGGDGGNVEIQIINTNEDYQNYDN